MATRTEVSSGCFFKMKMIRFYLRLPNVLFILICSVIVSCNFEPTIDDNESVRIKVDANLKGEVKLSEVCNEVKYLGLYNDIDLLPISEASKMIFKNGSFFLFDQNQGNVFIFSENGEFVNSFQILKGRGPYELERIADFSVDQINERIIVLGFAKLVVYTFDGKPIDELKMTVLPQKLTVYQEDFLFLLDSSSPERQVGDGYNLVRMSGDGTIVQTFLKSSYVENQKKYFLLVSNNFPEYNGEQLFFNSPDPNIYKVDEEFLKVKYTIDFGNLAIPNGYFDDILPEASDNEIIRNIFSDGYVSLLHNVLETDQQLYFQFATSFEENSSKVFFSKKSHNTKVGKTLVNDFDLSIETEISFFHNFKNYLVKTIFTSNLSDSEKNIVLESLSNKSKIKSEPELVLLMCDTKEF